MPVLRKSVCTLVALVLTAAAVVPTASGDSAQSAAPTAREVKAAFLFKFLGFVEWPRSAFSEPDAPIVIGVAGADAIFSDLEPIVAGRTAQGRRVLVKSVKPTESLAGLHVLFAGASAGSVIAKVPQVSPVLVVSDIEGALDDGSAINFVMADGRVRFEVAVDNAARRGIRLSSQLLAVALQVRTGKQ